MGSLLDGDECQMKDSQFCTATESGLDLAAEGGPSCTLVSVICFIQGKG